MKPIQLLVNILLREYEDIKFLAFDQVWTLGHLFYEHTQQIASLLEKFLAIVTEVLLLG